MGDINSIINNLEVFESGLGEVIQKALGLELKRIQADAKRLAPVDTGQLRNSIVTNVERDSELDFVGTVGTNVNHAPYVEFGTGPVGEKSTKYAPPDMTLSYRSDGWVFPTDDGEFRYTEGQPAKPFLYPAYKQNEEKVKKGIANAVKNAIKKNNG